MSGRKIIEGMKEALEVAKCRHAYVEGATVRGKRVLRCMFCKSTVYECKPMESGNAR